MKFVNKRIMSLILAGWMSISLYGCVPSELSGDTSDYDILETNDDNLNDGLKNGIKQIIPVQGENFSLVIEYSSDSSEWRITANKNLHNNS